MSALRHRGPDGSGVFARDGVCLAHTRLAVIDTTQASDQPMVDASTGAVLTFNGEIYNYRELRTDLEARGHRFHSTGDTEVLLRSYLQWGDRCLDRLNGMFAFAIFDPRDDVVFLARDRLGEKPLHLCRSDGAVWFASEIKALIAAGVASARADTEMLFRYLAMGDLGHPERTMLRGVSQLAAAHAARIDRTGRLRAWRYWEPPDSELRDSGRRPASGEVEDLLEDSVRLRLRSDVPLGTSLSGGVDSSTVLAMVRRAQPHGPLHAFTASFPGTDADELPNAEAVASKLGVTLHPVPLDGGDLSRGLDEMIRANEGPVESPSTYAQYRVMEEASRAGVTVLLDGQGADETWGGYDKYIGEAVLDRAFRGRWVESYRLASAWRNVHLTYPPVRLPYYIGLAGGRRIRRLLARATVATTAPWLARDFANEYVAADPLEPGPAAARPGHVAERNMLADLTRITLPRLLRYADRNSMAWSREVRLPFLDHRLVELACAVGFDDKAPAGWSKEPVRAALESCGLPDVARRRDKRAYMPPNDAWLAYPALDERIRNAWAELYAAGVLRAAVPVDGWLPRWRVLATTTWLDAFRISLQ